MKKRNLRVSIISVGVFVAVLALVATTSVALAARWRGHQTGGGTATVIAPPPSLVADVSPALGTSISFGMEAKADSLVAAPAPPLELAGLLQAAPGATIQGHGTWVDHSTSPPRVISLNNPVDKFVCDPVTGRGGISGWGTDSKILGPVYVAIGTFDGQAPAGPLNDQVFVRVFLAPPQSPPPPPSLYGANATASGEVVQHSCHE